MLEDSRCPIDAECVWAGRVTVELIFTQSDNQQTAKLALGDFTGTGYSDEATFGNFTVKLLGVKPAPVSYHTIPKGKYELELMIK